jgi:hypothetical protein
MNHWLVLGFTPDDVVVCWQDARLASACVHALNAAGRPSEFRIFQSSGDGDYLLTWYVNETAARVLDTHAVPWRSFIIGEAAASPAGARSPLADAVAGGELAR